MEISQDIWTEFMSHHSVTTEDLDNRYYTIDGYPEESLREIIVNNIEETTQDIMDVDYVIPFKEIYELKVGEQYVSGHTKGNITRVK